jgi:hypothetical protein
MKNLTRDTIVFDRTDGTRATLLPCEHPPIVEVVEAELACYRGSLAIVRQPYRRVIFPNWVDDPKGGPYVVTKDIFDLLPLGATDFVTPDYYTAIRNGLQQPHVVRRFITKAEAETIIVKQCAVLEPQPE